MTHEETLADMRDRAMNGPKHKTIAQIVNENLADIKTVYRLMTGQEWYDRFEKEYKHLLSEGHARKHKLSLGDIYQTAARKAANLDD